MKKNLLTIIIMALGILNMILTAVIVFAVVPTTIRTNELISKVASTIDLEINSSLNGEENQIDIADVEVYPMPEDLTINLKNSDDSTKSHYAKATVSLSLNTKAKDYKKLQPMVESNVTYIEEIISDEIAKYTVTEVNDTVTKEQIKKDILKDIQDYFKSDFIVSISMNVLAE